MIVNTYSTIPADCGCYCLHLNLVVTQRIQVGRLGEFEFPGGEYLYFGSALGSGGLRARIARHLRGDGRLHWHIDYLREKSEVIGYFYLVTNRRYECLWNQALMNYPSTKIPVMGFGASDCQGTDNACEAHLVWLEPGRSLNRIKAELSTASGSEVNYVNSHPILSPS